MQEENKVKKSFHKNMKAELKKVIWPTGKQVVKSTFATICFVLLVSAILIVLNLAFDFLNKKWFDLVLPGEEQKQENIVNISGDVISGDLLSGDDVSVETASGESNVSVDSGDANTITE